MSYYGEGKKGDKTLRGECHSLANSKLQQAWHQKHTPPRTVHLFSSLDCHGSAPASPPVTNALASIFYPLCKTQSFLPLLTSSEAISCVLEHSCTISSLYFSTVTFSRPGLVCCLVNAYISWHRKQTMIRTLNFCVFTDNYGKINLP